MPGCACTSAGTTRRPAPRPAEVPEGHTVHRLARRLARDLADGPVSASSPQGRFADGAACLDGLRVVRSDAHGKHLWLGLGPGAADAAACLSPRRWLHVHLGLYGAWTTGVGDPPAPRGALRLRLVTPRSWADLRGPTACELHDEADKDAVHARLGPDPLRRDGTPAPLLARVARSRTAVGTLLMQQDVVAGVGNVYRAEALFRAGLDPALPGRDVGADRVAGLWADLRVLLRDGVRRGRIVTTRPEHRPGGAVRREHAHYVYRRAGLPCRVCGTAVATRVVAGRNLFWCPTCQAG